MNRRSYLINFVQVGGYIGQPQARKKSLKIKEKLTFIIQKFENQENETNN